MSWDFTTRWFTSLVGVDRRLPKQRRSSQCSAVSPGQAGKIARNRTAHQQAHAQFRQQFDPVLIRLQLNGDDRSHPLSMQTKQVCVAQDLAEPDSQLEFKIFLRSGLDLDHEHAAIARRGGDVKGRASAEGLHG